MGVFIIFYGVNILYWWGLVALGTCFADEAVWYSIAMFIFTFFFLGGMLASGSKSNEKLRRAEYYEEVLNDY